MNETQKQIRLQQLNEELTKKRNAIKRRKDAIALQKLNDLMAEDENYCQRKKFFIEKIDGLRKQKSQYDLDHPRRYEIEDEARHGEHELSLLRNEHERNIHRINNRHMIARTALDDEERQLTEWFEQQKTAIMCEYVERKEADNDTTAEHKAD